MTVLLWATHPSMLRRPRRRGYARWDFFAEGSPKMISGKQVIRCSTRTPQTCWRSTTNQFSCRKVRVIASGSPNGMAESHVKPSGRKKALEHTRRLKMAASAHAYVRGNTLQFYDWLNSNAVTKTLPMGTPLWICGDCHIGNLGPAGMDGIAAFSPGTAYMKESPPLASANRKS